MCSCIWLSPPRLAFSSYLRGKPPTNYFIWLIKVVVVKADGLAARLTPERDLSMIVLGSPRVLKRCISQGSLRMLL